MVRAVASILPVAGKVSPKGGWNVLSKMWEARGRRYEVLSEVWAEIVGIVLLCFMFGDRPRP